VSQFTLHGYFQGNKPDFHLASKLASTIALMKLAKRIISGSPVGPTPARVFFDKFVQRVRNTYASDKVVEGVFGAYMDVAIVSYSS
jgi:D-tyrosyl-tRNA(Tyr) deacylase